MAKIRRNNKTTKQFTDSNVPKSVTSNLQGIDKKAKTRKEAFKNVSDAAQENDMSAQSRTTAKVFDFEAYKRLLTEIVPKVICSQDEYDRLEAKFEELLDKSKGRTLEEDSLFDLLANLLEDYERRTLLPLKPTSSTSTLKFLMEQNSLYQSDMVKYFGSQGNVSQVLAGKRAISKRAAQKLSERFKLSTDVFLKDM